MLISEPVFFTHEGKPARLYVLRNNGYCWGRIVFKDPALQQLDVAPPGNEDLYDETDTDAGEIFLKMAECEENVEPAMGAPL